VVVYEGARDVVLGAQSRAPQWEELGETRAGVEDPGARELDAGGRGDEGRLRRCVVAVVAVPEVEGQLREREYPKAYVQWGDLKAHTAVRDGLGGAVVEQRVEAGRGRGSMCSGERRAGG